jgi:hypothetical protein
MEATKNVAPNVLNVGAFRQAITTKYHGPTDARGSRVSAKAEPGQRFYSWDYALDAAGNHAVAAQQYAQEFGWTEYNDYVGGGTRYGYVFVAVPKGGA